MKARISARSLLVVPLLAVTLLLPRTSQLGPTTTTFVRHIPLAARECAAEVRAYPRQAAAHPDWSASCYATLTVVGSGPLQDGVASAAWNWVNAWLCSGLGCGVWQFNLYMSFNYDGGKAWLSGAPQPNPNCTNWTGFATFTLLACGTWGQNTGSVNARNAVQVGIQAFPGYTVNATHWLQVWGNANGTYGANGG